MVYHDVNNWSQRMRFLNCFRAWSRAIVRWVLWNFWRCILACSESSCNYAYDQGKLEEVAFVSGQLETGWRRSKLCTGASSLMTNWRIYHHYLERISLGALILLSSWLVAWCQLYFSPGRLQVVSWVNLHRCVEMFVGLGSKRQEWTLFHLSTKKFGSKKLLRRLLHWGFYFSRSLS